LKQIYGEYLAGWKPDLPDYRDYTLSHKDIAAATSKFGFKDSKGLPDCIDLRKWCPPIFDQGNLGSCTANAGVSLLEYIEIKTRGKYIDASRLFLYKVTRNLMHETGDAGAYLRKTMEAMVMIGIVPEEYWPYDVSHFDKEPSAFCYAVASNYKSLKYVSLDKATMALEDVLVQIKTVLAGGLAAIFGITMYDSISQSKTNGGKIPFPSDKENIRGGHAMMAVGYDNNQIITNEVNGTQTRGAFLIRNSWGTQWGDTGYGWLPYEYVLTGLAQDWWTLIDANWVDLTVFGKNAQQEDFF
jgi:C1A family cysteine protease